MRRLITGGRGFARVATVGLACVAGAGIAGCDLQENADLDRGRDLFVANCGTCHSLAEAGTGALVGPDLDASFAAARATGMDQDTIEGVVEDQIANPRVIHEDSLAYDRVFMPADIVTGHDAEDVAAYVASVAGIPGIKPPPLGTPEEVFVAKCGSCHTLSAAGTQGTVGPVLDDVIPDMSEQEIEESIRDPNAQIAPGFPEGVMPMFDEGQLPEENLMALIEYLIQSAGGGGGGTGTAGG